MKLYLAGNFNITDSVKKELTLKSKLGDNYNRLCTYYYPRAAETVLSEIKDCNIPIILPISEKGIKTKTHPEIRPLKKIVKN